MNVECRRLEHCRQASSRHLHQAFAFARNLITGEKNVTEKIIIIACSSLFNDQVSFDCRQTKHDPMRSNLQWLSMMTANDRLQERRVLTRASLFRRGTNRMKNESASSFESAYDGYISNHKDCNFMIFVRQIKSGASASRRSNRKKST